MSKTISRPDLESQGWELRFTASEPRISDHVELYRSLGFEVRLEPVHATDGAIPECGSCLDGGDVLAIFVRRPPLL